MASQASHSSSLKIPFGAAKLFRDIATLVNNPQGSDVQFKVGGSISTREHSETIYDESTAVIFYAHSLILRCRSPYFVTLLDNNEDWKKKSKCVIYKPNISPSTFRDILHYIYTGNVRTKRSDNIIELITIANEMGLEELSTECQSEFIYTIRNIFSDEANGSAEQPIPINIAIHTHIIPALNVASGHPLSHLSQELFTIMLPHISVITQTPEVYASFINGISSESIVKIIGSDELAMAEHNIWELALSWGCHQTELEKTDVEARLSNLDDDEDDMELSNEVIINDIQLKQLQKILKPLLPVVRFSLLDPEYYKQIAHILMYFLPRRRFLELSKFFCDSDRTRPVDAPRAETPERTISSKTIVRSMVWDLLRKNIFETGFISGCHSLNDLKFGLLFRASEHGFLASTFHNRCDNKGPTLVLIRSADGHLFGGVNFNHWKSDRSWSSSLLNFLFALPDGYHRKDPVIFRVEDKSMDIYSFGNFPGCGPFFGFDDLVISNSANINQYSYSCLPSSYNGRRASDTALAGSRNFMVSDYEVFAISKQ